LSTDKIRFGSETHRQKVREGGGWGGHVC
jgi:hypothetical protein